MNDEALSKTTNVNDIPFDQDYEAPGEIMNEDASLSESFDNDAQLEAYKRLTRELLEKIADAEGVISSYCSETNSAECLICFGDLLKCAKRGNPNLDLTTFSCAEREYKLKYTFQN